MADDEVGAGGPARRRGTGAAAGGARKSAAAAKKSAATRKAGSVPAAPVKKSAAKRSAGTTAAKAGARKPITRRTGATLASGSEARRTAPPASTRRLAAEQTFDDDWEPPAPAPSGPQPSDRIRAALRSAAADIRAREAGSPTIGGYPVGPSRPPEPVRPAEPARPAEPVTEIIVGPERSEPPRRARRTLAVPPPEPEPEPEWSAEDQPLDEEPPVDRIPDAMDVLSVPGAPPSPPPRTSTRRFPPPPPAPASMPPPPPDAPAVDTEPPPAEPPTWTPSPPIPAGAESGAGRRGRLGGRGRVVAVVLLVLVLAGAAVLVVAARDQGIDYSKLKVGDCFDSSATNEVRGIDVKPCSEEHNSEVFFLVTHPAGPADPYPGKDALVQFAADACLGQPLTDYLGIPLEQSTLKDFEIVPQESAWKDGRRVLVCGLDTGGEGRITGSVKGTSR